ncbi:MAG TPA: hypothetical protein VJ972_00070 [Anaerolineales bacterium]|nr:hypothetical protein [Anaerolineales bacterium]
MLEQHNDEIVLTPEQRHQLGHVYRIILSWRRQRKNKLEGSSQSTTTLAKRPSPLITSQSTDLIESEA